MLSQAHLAPLTEENLKKHQRETTRKPAHLKKILARETSLRSAGDGESTELVCDETVLQASFDDRKSDAKQTLYDRQGKLPSDSNVSVVLQDMSKQKTTTSPDNSAQGEKSSKTNRPLSENDREQSPKVDGTENESSSKERNEEGYELNSNKADNSATENDDNDEDSDEDSDSSSSVDSDSDSVVVKDSKSDEENEDSNADSEDCSRSSSPLVEDDDDDDDNDDDDDDDDDSEEEEEMEEGVKSDDELTHYSSSLNASVSSIPTICDDREMSPESPNSMDEFPELEQEENVEHEKENEVANEEVQINKDEEVKVEEEEPVEKEGTLNDHEGDNYTPPGSRQVSGRSATPLTVVVSEFDEVESTIFDRREPSPPCSSARDKLTPSENSERSEVSIKNWPGVGQGCVTSKTDSAKGLADKQATNKRLKTRKERNAIKPNLKNASTTREPQHRLTSKRTTKKTDNAKKTKFIRRVSVSSNDSVNNQSNKVTRRKRRPTKQVSFDNSQIETITKITTSDSAFFGSHTESRGDEEQASPRPPESEHSGRASSRWSAVESERGSGTGTRPVSTVQSQRSFFSSRQTSLVEKVTAVNRTPLIHGRKTRLPSLRSRTSSSSQGKLSDYLLHFNFTAGAHVAVRTSKHDESFM